MTDFAERLVGLSRERVGLVALSLHAQLEKLQQARTEPIAIVGLGARFPGAPSPAAFWELLRNGVDAVTEFPGDRWEVDRYYSSDPEMPGKAYSRHGGFIAGHDLFDPGFFGITPREADHMDPQQRLLLEVVWEALEHASLPPAQLATIPTGVFVGISTNDQLQMECRRGKLEEMNAYTGTGTTACMAAGRVSYALGLHGPNLAVDTACSSSLVAVHLACQSLHNGECRVAIAGGVGMLLAPESFVYFSKVRALSLGGRCKSYDAVADGYVRGEGCGAIVLKRLSDAQRDNDRIFAVLLGSALNHDGRTRGLTVPNGKAQESVLREALAKAGVAPHEISYVEGHGTGTPLGDPIEMEALGAVMGEGRPKDQPLLVGSVKTNIGHLEAAAGIAGLIKAVLALHQGQIPPHLHFQRPNPYIRWNELPIKIPTVLTPWPEYAVRRLAGVSSFGFSGTNAHIVLEAAPRLTASDRKPVRPVHLLCLSAKDDGALKNLAEEMGNQLAQNGSLRLADVAHTASAGRSHFAHRLTVSAEDTVQAGEALRAFAAGQPDSRVGSGAVEQTHAAKVAFLFTGQGSHYAGMGRVLYQTQPTFRRTLEECDSLLRPLLKKDLLSVLFTQPGEPSLLGETSYSQPALFSLQFALASLWRDWGIEPAIVMGHSIGEYAAACVAGILSLPDALKLVAHRGRLMQSVAEEGRMIALDIDEGQAAQFIAPYGDRLSIAAVNAPRSVVISGGRQEIESLVAKLAVRGLEAFPLNVKTAFHSQLMEPILEEFLGIAREVSYGPARIGFLSTVSGEPLREGQMGPEYWQRQIRKPVRFADAAHWMLQREYGAFLEIGPKPVLLGLVRRFLPSGGPLLIPSLLPTRDDWKQIMDAVSQLYLLGTEIDWRRFDADFSADWVTLPSYPFQRKRHFRTYGASTPASTSEARPSEEPPSSPAESVADWLYSVRWEPKLPPKSPPEHLEPSRWLIFADDGGVGEALAARLKALGESPVCVLPGAEFSAPSDGAWRLNPADRNQYARVVTKASALPELPLRGVVHLWSLHDASPWADEDDAMGQQLLGSASVLALAQALVKQHELKALPLCLVTRGAQPAGEKAALTGVLHAPIWGVAGAIAMECPALRCLSVDLDPIEGQAGGPAKEAASLVSALWPGDNEDRVAYRQGQRYVARLIRRRDLAASSPTSQINPDASYLITGGLGGLGLSVAGWLVKMGARHLALMGRRGPSLEAQQIIDEIRKSGATVRVVQGDVSEAADVQRVFAEIAESLPPLRGVVHAAGVIEDAALPSMEPSAFEAVLRPKLAGAWNLHRQTAEMPLEFMVFFSSVAALLGSPGQANYVAANVFLDALAHYRRALGLPALSINWGMWTHVGMASRRDAATVERFAAMGVYGSLAPEVALEALGMLLSSGAGQAGVLQTDWKKLFQMLPLGLHPPLLSALAKEYSRVQASSRRWLALLDKIKTAAATERRRLVENYVETVVAEVLHLEQGAISRQTGFFDLGMDSLMSLELRNRLQSDVGNDHALPMTLVFDRNSIEALAEYLHREVLSTEEAPVLPAAVQFSDDPIAIVGMACRFPGGASDTEGFWKLMRQGVDAVTEVPPNRWNLQDYYDPNPDAPGKMYVRHGAFLENIADFDAEFFGISRREALCMDPQHRLLLEVAWEALENAHQPADRLRGSRTGIFVGISNNDYVQLLAKAMDHKRIDAYLGVGNALSIAAGRVSHVLALQGPSLAIDTACSSSLVAVHQACESLRAGSCRMALAGGVNLTLVPEINVSLCKARMLAPDGRCKTFDATADGYVRGEGCGLVVLKRLSDAHADGDEVLALIRGSAVNHNGPSSGLTVPNGQAQQELLRQAMADAGIGPGAVDYVEAHGTGTSLGDPIEMQALGEVFRDGDRSDRPLLVGTVKTNIGHLESAAGIAGLLKVVVSLRHGEIPPNLHFRQPSPYIAWNELPVQVPTEAVDWHMNSRPRVAGVSSFGFSGTNAAVVVQEPPQNGLVVKNPTERSWHLLCLSAKSEEALRSLAGRVADLAASPSAPPIGDLCYSAGAGRAHLRCRLALLTNSNQQAASTLARFVEGQEAPLLRTSSAHRSGAPKVAFLFGGQSSQAVGLGRQLFQTQPSFQRTLQLCEDILRPLLERPLLSVLYPKGENDSLIQEPAYALPSLFAVEYALAQLWQSWGIEPALVMGCGTGEFAAASFAGVFSLQEGLKLAAECGRLMQGQTEADAIFHSPRIESILDRFEAATKQVTYSPPRYGVVSSVTGQLIGNAEICAPSYWRDQMRQAARLEETMQLLVDRGCDVFLEIGRDELISTSRPTLPGTDQIWVRPLQPGDDDWKEMLGTLQTLYLHKAAVDWRGFDADYARHWVDLPNYPFQRQRFWNADEGDRGSDFLAIGADAPDSSATPPHPYLGSLLSASGADQWMYENRFSVESPAFLADHHVYSLVVVPASSHLSMLFSAASATPGGMPLELAELSFPEAIIVPEDGASIVRLVFSEEGGSRGFRVMSRVEGEGGDSEDPDWTLHATGTVVRGIEAPHRPGAQTGRDVHVQTGDAPAAPSVEQILARCEKHMGDSVLFYDLMERRGIQLGSSFRWVEQIWQGQGEVLGRMREPHPSDGVEDYVLHPGLIDSCFQLMGAALATRTVEGDAFIPVSIERVRFYGPTGARFWHHIRLRPQEDASGNTFIADMTLFDDQGVVLANFDGLRIHRAPRSVLTRFAQRRIREPLYSIHWIDKSLVGASQETTAGAAIQPGCWLILADQRGVGKALAGQLTTLGERCVEAYSGNSYLTGSDGVYQIDPANPGDFERLLAEGLPAGHSRWRGVVLLWSAESDEAQLSAVQKELTLSCQAGLHLAQALGRIRDIAIPRLWLVTRNTQAVDQDLQPVSLGHAPLWGLGRVLASEQPALRSTLIDLPAGGTVEEDAQWLTREFRADVREDQFAFRNGTTFVPRLMPYTHASGDNRSMAIPEGPSYQLVRSEHGIIDELRLSSADRREPRSGEVEISLHATGMNFRDVVNALGLYPGDAGPLGGECAGTITRVGEAVEGLAAGDRVMAIAPGCFDRFVTIDARLVVPLPEAISFEDGATISVAFVTAHYGLDHLAHMQRGDKVLIHAAAGGVGLAAVQLAQRAGAEIYATAGSPAKRDFLRSLGIENVFDSRSFEYEDAIRQIAPGGLRIVLNSLAGEFIPHTLSLLGEGGHFVELGKVAIWDAAQMAAARRDVTYNAIALDKLIVEESAFVGAMMRDLMNQVAEGQLKPLPRTVFPIQEAIHAFRFMAQAKHIGKIVVVHPQADALNGRTGSKIKPEATYLITGGLGGLGLILARWLVDKGARHLVLLARSASRPEARKVLDDLAATGADVRVEQADVADRTALAGVLGRVAAEMPPLAGVFHLAGVLDDGILLGQDWPRFRTVLAPKVQGALHLHELTRNLPLDLFVLFSSAASMLGFPSQGNYAAANAFLDALAQHRRANGLPAMAINWGPWSEAGMAAEAAQEVHRQWAAAGIGTIGTKQGLETLDLLLQEDANAVGVLPIEWSKLSQRFAPPLLAYLAEQHKAALEPTAEWLSFVAAMKAAPPAERKGMLVRFMLEQARLVLGADASQVLDPYATLNELGVDSLMAVELANRLGSAAGVSLSATLLFDYPTIDDIAGFFLREIIVLEQGEKAEDSCSPRAEDNVDGAESLLDAIERLSDQEVDRLSAPLAHGPEGV